MMVFSARLTQAGHKIKDMDDLMALYEKWYSEDTVRVMTDLPHPTIQKFGIINVVVVGASRRFLAQLTRHQNEVKFMSASLQYSDYSDENDFVVPYELLNDPAAKAAYLKACQNSMGVYKNLIQNCKVDSDTTGYIAPQGLRNVLMVSATPYQLKHMIGQRICRRNTSETRYVMLKIWEQLYEINPAMFSVSNTGAYCQRDRCPERKMSCQNPIFRYYMPIDILHSDFPLLSGKR